MSLLSAASSQHAYDERRGEGRRPLFGKARLIIERQIVSGRTLDVSISGLAVVADINPPLGLSCVVEFSLPGQNGLLQMLELQATVLNTVLTRDGFRIGLKFDAPSARTRQLLQNYVEIPQANRP